MTEHEEPVPPQNNMGGTNLIHDKACTVSVDWFTCTYRQELVPVEAVEKWFMRFCARYVAKRCRFIHGGRRNGFEKRLTCMLKDESASIATGGNRGWAMLEIRGALCSLIDPTGWARIRRLCEKLQARITRCDLAADFFMGEIDIAELEGLYRVTPGRVLDLKGPVPRIGIADQGNGRTLYIGTRSSSRQLCVYQKGLQLGRLCPEWVRVEIRYRRQNGDAVIPYRVLSWQNWWDYVAGLGPYFAVLKPSAEAQAVMYNNKVASAALLLKAVRMFDHVKDTYGKYLFFLTQVIPENLIVPGLLNEVGEWSHLKNKPDWKQDRAFMEQVSAALLSMVPRQYHEANNYQELPDPHTPEDNSGVLDEPDF